MATQVKHRRGAQSEIDNFTPAIAEIVVNTSESELVLGDGATQGGVPIPKKAQTTLTFDSVAQLKSTNVKAGQLVQTKGYYEKQGFGGATYLIKTSQEAVDDGDTVDGYGSHDLNNGNVAVLKVGLSVNVEQFGAVADGVLSDGSINPTPTDNADAFQAACNYLIRGTYPEYQGGKLEFRGGVHVCYATSGGTQLPECKIIGNQCKIRPLNAPNYIFNLNLLHTTNTRRFTKNWLFEGFTMWTDRGFGVDFSSVDCDHFLKITGGWLIRSKIQNIDVDPGFACRSLVLWDLTHPDVGSVQEIGVPDGIIFDSISAQYAENTSFAISFLGDQLGTGSRLGSTTFRDIYNAITYPHDYTTRGQAFNDFGVLRIDNVDFGRAKIEELFGVQPIRMFNDSEFANSYFRYLYVEFNRERVSDFESILRGGTYRNCDFEYVNMYTENTNLSAPPRFFFTTFEQCRFGRISAFVQSQLTNAPDANFINLGANSFGNTIEAKPLISNQPDDPGMGWLLKRISAPADTVFEFLKGKTISRTVKQTISADGEYLLGSVPSDLTEITAFVKAKLAVHKITQVNVDVSLKFAGAGMGNTRTGPVATLTNASTNDASLIGQFIGRNDQVVDPSPTQFSVNAVYTFEATGETGTTIVNGSEDLSIQYNSGDYEVYLVVANLSGGDIEVANFELEYGHSDEYVNVI